MNICQGQYHSNWISTSIWVYIFKIFSIFSVDEQLEFKKNWCSQIIANAQVTRHSGVKPRRYLTMSKVVPGLNDSQRHSQRQTKTRVKSRWRLRKPSTIKDVKVVALNPRNHNCGRRRPYGTMWSHHSRHVGANASARPQYSTVLHDITRRNASGTAMYVSVSDSRRVLRRAGPDPCQTLSTSTTLSVDFSNLHQPIATVGRPLNLKNASHL